MTAPNAASVMSRDQLLAELEVERFGAPVQEWHNGDDTPTAVARRRQELRESA